MTSEWLTATGRRTQIRSVLTQRASRKMWTMIVFTVLNVHGAGATSVNTYDDLPGDGYLDIMTTDGAGSLATMPTDLGSSLDPSAMDDLNGGTPEVGCNKLFCLRCTRDGQWWCA